MMVNWHISKSNRCDNIDKTVKIIIKFLYSIMMFSFEDEIVKIKQDNLYSKWVQMSYIFDDGGWVDFNITDDGVNINKMNITDGTSVELIEEIVKVINNYD